MEEFTTIRRLGLPPPQGEVLMIERPAAAPPGRKRRFTEKDAMLLVLRSVLTLVARTLPVRWWPHACAVTASLRLARKRRRHQGLFAARAAALLGPQDAATIDRLFTAVQRRAHERHLTFVRERHAPLGVQTDVVGHDNLAASLARGRGAIIWVTPALGDTVVTKRALAGAGIRAHQVSARSHGFSQSAFAIRRMNPAQIAIEDGYLAGRILFDAGQPAQAARALREVTRRLARNEVVLFTNSTFAGRSFVAVPFGAGFRLALASGPMNLCLGFGVPLHVATTIEVTPFSRYTTTISPDLAQGDLGSGAGDRDLALATLAVRAVAAIRPFACAHPDQIRIWDAILDLPDAG